MGQIEKKSRRFIVLCIEREPGDQISALLKSLRPTECKRRLAESHPGFDDRELLRLRLPNQIEQPGSFNVPGYQSRQPDLGPKKLWLRSRKHLIPNNNSRFYAILLAPLQRHSPHAHP